MVKDRLTIAHGTLAVLGNSVEEGCKKHTVVVEIGQYDLVLTDEVDTGQG